MKKNIKYILSGIAFSVCGSISAQNLSSAYFLDGYAFGHELNPAKDYDRKSYFTVLPISNWNLGFHSNFGLQDFVRKNPNGNGLISFLHPSLSKEEALKGFSSNNKFLFDMRMDVISVGFHKFNGFNNITLGVRADIGFNVPGEYFELMKEISNQDYDFSDMGIKINSWAELALGHSRQINDAWRVGGKLKFLVGAAYARINMDNVDMNLAGKDKWIINAIATGEVGIKGFSWGEPEIKEYNNKKNPDGTPMTYEQVNFDNTDIDGIGPNGFGMAFDLGAEWDLGKQGIIDGMKVSASLMDLGFIRWKEVSMARNMGEEFVFDGFKDIQVKDGPGESFEDQADKIGDRFSDLISLQDMGKKSRARALGATMNLALEYQLPMYKKLSFGFLSTTRIQGAYSWNEERFSCTVSPAKMFEVSGNVGFGTLGTNVGWIINFHPRVFNLFIGSDHCIGKFSKQGIPLKSNYDITIGITHPIGKVRKDKI